MSVSKYALVVTTFESKEEASMMAKKLLDVKLAACVQLEVIESFYNFEDECHQDLEYRLQIKTHRDLYDQLETFILAQHSYDTPELILIPIQNGSADYLSWIDDSLKERAQ